MGPSAMWSSLSVEHQRWMAVNALVVTAVINAFLNGVIAWASVHGDEDVPFFSSTGETSVLTDSLGTLFVLPLITCLVLTTLVRRELREGSLEPVRIPLPVELADGRLVRGLAFGALTLSLLGAPVAVTLLLSGVGEMGTSQFVAYKAGFGVVLGAIVTPVIALRALADPVGREDQAAGLSVPGPTSFDA